MFGFVNKKFLIFSVLSITLAVYYDEIRNAFNNIMSVHNVPLVKTSARDGLFTNDELLKFSGENNDEEIYLSILGSVYDVTRGKKHYGKGSSYSFFTGRDASVSFLTGDFDEYTPSSDDVLQLKPADLLSLQHWKEFYDKEYIYKGKLIGRFYDETGAETEYSRRVAEIVELAETEKQEEAKRQEEFPSCNIEWSEKSGTKVWCSKESGGKLRSWIGVPRKYFEHGKSSYRCACIEKNSLNHPHIKEYDNCDPDSNVCFYKVDE